MQVYLINLFEIFYCGVTLPNFILNLIPIKPDYGLGGAYELSGVVKPMDE